MPHESDYAEVERRTPEEAQAIVLRQLEQALDWRQENLDPLLEKATEAYLGKPYGNEQKGRSQIVMTEVRDTTRSLMTALTKLFFGPDRVVEFEPVGPEDEALAEQRTDYINHIVEQDNDGYQILTAAWKDALVRKLGIVTYWWDEMERVEGSQHTGLAAEQVDFLAASTDVDEIEVFERPDGLFDVEIKRRITDGRARIEAINPEDFVFSPTARSRDDARLIGHVREVPASDLIAMGVDPELVERSKGEFDADDDLMDEARRFDGDIFRDQEDEQPEETRPVRFADLYVRIDLDGDGIAELRHIQAVGPKAEWVDEDPPIVDHAPFALFEMDPEPHTMVGISAYDDTGDLQRINSFIVRGMLDSLALSLNPATEVVEGRVNIKDLLNPEVGRIVRSKGSLGQMREIETPFVGAAALPVLQFLQETRENRTGQSKAAAGLDPDALQSTTRAAVAATVSAAAQRQEMIARNFAEGGMKQLFKGLLKLVTQHQDRERVVRLRGQFVAIDPSQWDADADVRVNVALGTGLMEERKTVLMNSAQKMEEHLASGSPLGSYAKLRDAYARMLRLAGFQNADAFWPPMTEEQEAQIRQQQAQNQPPSENEVFREIEMAKIQSRQQEKMAELQLKMAELEIKRREVAVKEADVERKADEALVDRQFEAARLQLEELSTLASTRVGE